MVSPEGGFRIRAASLLQTASPFRNQSISTEPSITNRSSHVTSSPTTAPLTEEARSDNTVRIDKSASISSNEKTLASLSGDAIVEKSTRRFVRTTPAWVNDLTDEDEDQDVTSGLLPKSPPGAQIAQHNSSPSTKNKKHEPGHLHDTEREWDPPTSRHHVTEIGSRWRNFADMSRFPTAVSAKGGQRVTEQWLIDNGPDYSQPWQATGETDLEKHERRVLKTHQKVWWKQLQHTLLRNPLVPLFLRLIVWFFSFIALILGGLIFRTYRSSVNARHNNASPIMAIIIDGSALFYIVYITRDEYTGKPLGLRSGKAKMRLIFLDIFFIVFDSANLSLAFEAVTDATAPPSCPLGQTVCGQQQALASVLLVALIAWMMTFAVSVLRVVERIGGPTLND